MNKYIVYVLECHQVQFECKAVDKNDAIEQAMSGNGRWVDNSMEFVDSLDTDTWTVELIEEGEPPDPTDKEAYALNKISELTELSKKETSAHFKDLIDSSIEDLKEELKIARAGLLKNIEEMDDD